MVRHSGHCEYMPGILADCGSGDQGASKPLRKMVSSQTAAGTVSHGVAAMLPSAELAPDVFGPLPAPHQLFANVFGLGTLAPCAFTSTPVPPSTQLSRESSAGRPVSPPAELLMKLAVLPPPKLPDPKKRIAVPCPAIQLRATSVFADA